MQKFLWLFLCLVGCGHENCIRACDSDLKNKSEKVLIACYEACSICRSEPSKPLAPEEPIKEMAK